MSFVRACFVSLGFALPAAAVLSQTPTAANTNDSVVAMRVKAALIEDEATKASQINVEARSGIVQLSGFVDSEAMRAAAASAAGGVAGVKGVQNKLMLRDPNRTAGQAIDDTVIAARVKGELAGKTGLGTATRVNVEVNSGIVELSGFVSTSDQKAQAAAVARGVDGVRDVRNHISLKPNS